MISRTEMIATIEPTGAGERVFAWKLEPSHKLTELLLVDLRQPGRAGASDVTAFRAERLDGHDRI